MSTSTAKELGKNRKAPGGVCIGLGSMFPPEEASPGRALIVLGSRGLNGQTLWYEVEYIDYLRASGEVTMLLLAQSSKGR